MVVAVLMISCQVSMLRISRIDGAHTRTISRQQKKNQARATTRLTDVASLSNRLSPLERREVIGVPVPPERAPMALPEGFQDVITVSPQRGDPGLHIGDGLRASAGVDVFSHDLYKRHDPHSAQRQVGVASPTTGAARGKRAQLSYEVQRRD